MMETYMPTSKGYEKVRYVEYKGSKVYFYDNDDLVSFIHSLAMQGKTISEIADILGLSVRVIRRYLETC